MERKVGKTVLEFFAGIGLMRSGLEKSGWRIIMANDIDPVKKRLYLNHFGEDLDHFVLEDIHNLKGGDMPNVSLATASFPCTDLSLAGKREGLQGKQSSAFWGFVNVLDQLNERRPPLILLENVPGFLTSNRGKDIYDALLALNKLGYSVDVIIINAMHFVPQSRVRLFIVGKQKSNVYEDRVARTRESELRPKKLVEFINSNPDIDWDIEEALPSLPDLKDDISSIVETILPKTSREWWSRERVEYLLNQTSQKHLEKMLKLRDADKYTYLTAFRRIRSGKSMAEVRFDGIAGCLRTPKGGSARQILIQVGKGEINVRLLSPVECARLMGADDFKISGSTNEALFGFGDAVCVPVVSWIAENYLDKEVLKLNNEERKLIKEYAVAT